MSDDKMAQDPMEFMRGMWSNMGFSLPGMVTPTLDVNELDKRIADLKAVEGWLKMNLNMLQMTTQGLEMQRNTIAAVQAIGQVGRQQEPGEAPPVNPFASAIWPWKLMQQGSAAESDDGGAAETKPAKGGKTASR